MRTTLPEGAITSYLPSGRIMVAEWLLRLGGDSEGVPGVVNELRLKIFDL